MLKRICSYVSDTTNIERDDIMLAAYQKTGSTWIRFLFCNLISLNEWNGKLVDFDLLNETMISYGQGKLKKKWKHSIPRFVKTHRKYYPIFRNNQIILMLRDPRDVMISYYHYLKAKKDPVYHFRDVKMKKTYEDTFTNFIQHPNCGFESFFEHYNSWKDKADIIIKYEDFKRNPVDEFTKLLEHLSINADSNLIEEAVRRSDVKNVRSIEIDRGHTNIKRDFNKDFKFTRNGSIEQWKDVYTEEQMKIYERFRGKYNFDIESYK